MVRIPLMACKLDEELLQSTRANMAMGMDRVDHDPFDDHVRVLAHGDRRIVVIRGQQAAPFPVEDLAGHLPVDDRHNDAPVLRFHGPVHDQEVAAGCLIRCSFRSNFLSM